MLKGILLLLFIPIWVYGKTLTLILDWFPNPTQAPLFVAQTQGYFAKEDLQVNLITPADPADAAKLVASNQADIGIDYESHYVLETSQGLPLSWIATLINSPLTALVTLDNSSIHTLKDLSGKTIAGSSHGILLRAWLKKNGVLNPIFLTVHYNLLQALLSHQVDAVSDLSRNFELIALEQQGIAYRAFYPEQFGVPFYHEMIFIVHQKNKDSDWVKAFNRALANSIAYLREHPEKAWHSVIAEYPAMDTPLNKASWFATLPYFPENPAHIDSTQDQPFREFVLNEK